MITSMSSALVYDTSIVVEILRLQRISSILFLVSESKFSMVSDVRCIRPYSSRPGVVATGVEAVELTRGVFEGVVTVVVAVAASNETSSNGSRELRRPTSSWGFPRLTGGKNPFQASKSSIDEARNGIVYSRSELFDSIAVIWLAPGIYATVSLCVIVPRVTCPASSSVLEAVTAPSLSKSD